MTKISLKMLKPKGIQLKKIKFKKRYIFIGIVAIVIIAILTKTFLFKSLPSVSNYTVLADGEIVNSISASGTVESNNVVNVHSEVNSTIEKINIKEGDKVEKGQVIAILSSDQIKNDIQKSEAEIKTSDQTNNIDLQSKKRIYEKKLYVYDNNMDKDIKSAETTLNAKETQLEQNQKTYEGNQELFEYGEISQVDLDKSKTDYEAAKKEYDEAVTALESAKVDAKDSVDTAKEEYEAAKVAVADRSKQVELQEKKKELEECTILAPVSGTVTKVNAVEGGESSGVLFTIEDINDVYIEVPIKAVDIMNIKVGQETVVKTDTKEDDEGVKGKVISITDTTIDDGKADSSSSSTSSSNNANFKARIKLDKISDNIKVGIKATAEIIIEKSNKGFAVPFECINENGDKSSVFVAQKIEDEKYIVKEIPVKTGMETDFSVQIFSDKIKANDIVLNDLTYPAGTEINLLPNEDGGAISE